MLVTGSQSQLPTPKELEVTETTIPAVEKVTVPTLPDSLVVSFYSRGEGAPFKVIKEFDSYLSDYVNQASLKDLYDRIPWGREGEIDYCLRLSQLPNNKKLALINRIREITSKTELVHVTDNGTCRMRERFAPK